MRGWRRCVGWRGLQDSAAAGSAALAAAFVRAAGVAFQHRPEPMTWVGRCDAAPCPAPPPPPNRALQMGTLVVSVSSANESLGHGTSENYTLSVAFPNASIAADSIYGAMRALETFAQLIQCPPAFLFI